MVFLVLQGTAVHDHLQNHEAFLILFPSGDYPAAFPGFSPSCPPGSLPGEFHALCEKLPEALLTCWCILTGFLFTKMDYNLKVFSGSLKMCISI